VQVSGDMMWEMQKVENEETKNENTLQNTLRPTLLEIHKRVKPYLSTTKPDHLSNHFVAATSAAAER